MHQFVGKHAACKQAGHPKQHQNRRHARRCPWHKLPPAHHRPQEGAAVMVDGGDMMRHLAEAEAPCVEHRALASVGALASLCLIQPRRLHQHERWLHGKGHLHQGVESKDLAVEGLTVRGVHHNGTQASVADMAAVLQSDVLVSPWLKPVAGVTPRGAVRKVPPAVLGAPEGVLGVLHSAVWPGGDEGAADDALWPEPFPVAMWVEGSSIVDREHPIGDDSPTSITSEAGCVP
mmetsp:Transcript_31875/g.75712  ORF Transcript_31875/g.75712 Transcript_31875/m.75712 type:complete len:233 (-) Transcript_31875:1198-1896(-)